MDAAVADGAAYLLDRLTRLPDDQRLLVGCCGRPASGKTTFALLLTKTINRLYRAQQQQRSDIAICIPQDGFHHTRAMLDTFPDVKEAYDRRGAAFTFDDVGYYNLVSQLRQPIHAGPRPTIITAPSFEHAIKDPVPDSIIILPTARIVILEGLYTFLATDGWKKSSELLDERWFVDADAKTATTRIVLRHVATGVAKDMDEAIWRAANNDMPNGDFLTANMMTPTRIIKSVDDPSLSTLPLGD
ncbi:P-loop containing nucleoside triphosphate hydrolase protein [Calocera cornea HHB12733]|uniref:p-loop containing nucleoside triphosphate hydrolase protein n=1 Tax=Calocera cornea HHB12733 TaxID=1353952 RepID=A0A165JHJ3_9BASI|nr:P-loop containing nucleoside triphosphate hydrolase protein [Calocera cornea HHB12733]